MAERINLNPIIELRGTGSAPCARPSINRRAALERVLSIWRRHQPESAALHVVAMHSGDATAGQDLLDLLLSETTAQTAFVSSFGTPLVAHTGPGMVGLAWWWEDLSGRPSAPRSARL